MGKAFNFCWISFLTILYIVWPASAILWYKHFCWQGGAQVWWLYLLSLSSLSTSAQCLMISWISCQCHYRLACTWQVLSRSSRTWIVWVSTMCALSLYDLVMRRTSVWSTDIWTSWGISSVVCVLRLVLFKWRPWSSNTRFYIIVTSLDTLLINRSLWLLQHTC